MLKCILFNDNVNYMKARTTRSRPWWHIFTEKWQTECFGSESQTSYRCVVSGDGCPGEGLVFGDTTGTYWGITLVVEDCWFLILAGENVLADDVNGKDFRTSEWWVGIAGLLETLSKRLPVERMASTGLLGSVASTMWIRSRPAVVVRRSNSWTRLFWMRARSLRRISHSLSNASLSSAICKPTVPLQCVCCLLRLHCYVWNSSNGSGQRSVKSMVDWLSKA